MAEQHRATPEQWQHFRRVAADHHFPLWSVQLELADRIAALEAHRETERAAPAIKPPKLSDEEADRLWDSTIDLSLREATRIIHRAGWDAAMAAVAQQQQQPAPPAPAPDGSLVEAIIDAGAVLSRQEARAVIRAVAEWFESYSATATAGLLRREADR